MPFVLFVEDETSVREVAGRILSDRGYLVIAASDGAVALQLLEQISPDLIILDLYLPVLDGRRFVHRYRQRPEPHAPILIMTGWGHAAQRAAALDVAGALDKPFSLQELLTKVEGRIGPAISRN
jgi:two-component system, OmpR family, response regulator TrcR